MKEKKLVEKVCPLVGKKCIGEKCEFANTTVEKIIINEGRVLTPKYLISLKNDTYEKMKSEAKSKIIEHLKKSFFSLNNNEYLKIIDIILKNPEEYETDNSILDYCNICLWYEIVFQLVEYKTTSKINCNIKQSYNGCRNE